MNQSFFKGVLMFRFKHLALLLTLPALVACGDFSLADRTETWAGTATIGSESHDLELEFLRTGSDTEFSMLGGFTLGEDARTGEYIAEVTGNVLTGGMRYQDAEGCWYDLTGVMTANTISATFAPHPEDCDDAEAPTGSWSLTRVQD